MKDNIEAGQTGRGRGESVKPKRIQRRRAKGWRKPKGAVYVGRGSPWGNPFVTGKHGRRSRCVQLHKFLLRGYLTLSDGDVTDQMECFNYVQNNIKELRGKDLMCWCPLDGPCHADYLLEIANREE